MPSSASGIRQASSTPAASSIRTPSMRILCSPVCPVAYGEPVLISARPGRGTMGSRASTPLCTPSRGVSVSAVADRIPVASCAPAIAPPATRRTPRAAAPASCRRWFAPHPTSNLAGATRIPAKRSTCACHARRVRPIARWASTWPRTSPSSSPTTTGGACDHCRIIRSDGCLPGSAPPRLWPPSSTGCWRAASPVPHPGPAGLIRDAPCPPSPPAHRCTPRWPVYVPTRRPTWCCSSTRSPRRSGHTSPVPRRESWNREARP